MKLRPYQVEGALWLTQSPHGLLADPPGLGKSAEATTAARTLDAKTVVIICPAIAVANWRREWRMWWPGGPEPLITSYDKVVRDRPLRNRMAQGMDCLILDEAHYLKNRDSKRTLMIYNPSTPDKGLASRAKYVWALSGTFAPNNVVEYWTHLRALFPQLIPSQGGVPMSHDEFLTRYTMWTPSAFGPKVHGTKNGTELAAILRRVGLRREIADVLPDLPPIVWGQLTVDDEAAREQVDRMKDSPEVLELYQHLWENENFHAFTIHLSRLRRLIGEAKAGVLAEIVNQELDEKQYGKIVIWAHHTSVIEAMAASLAGNGVAVIQGATSQPHRARSIERFQTDPACRVLIGQLQAAGTAINLTACNQVLFAECSWVPAENLQAAKRCHRLGQRRPVFVRISALDDSIDELIAATIQRKLDNHIEVGEQQNATAN